MEDVQLFGGGCLVGPDIAWLAQRRQRMAGLFVFLAWLTSLFATSVECILMASSILYFFSACSFAFFFCRWN